MGLDPEHSDYEPGIPCPICNDVIFGGVTPKYVHIEFSGIEKCPGTERAAYNRGFVLTQTDNPCVWEWTECAIMVQWQLEMARSRCQLWNIDHFEFVGDVFTQCVDHFNNLMNCDDPMTFHHGGTAVITWGTNIGPPPWYRGIEEGLINETCVDRIFDGSTPKYVLACVSGGVSCYPLFASYPRGPYLLTQREGSNVSWYRETSNIWIEWVLQDTYTRFLMGGSYRGMRRFWFDSGIQPICDFLMDNTLVCGPGGPLGQGGNVRLFW